MSRAAQSIRKRPEADDETEPTADNLFGQAEDDENLKGHPGCVAQEDCQGSVEDVLIRYMPKGKPGDMYCKTCWGSFLSRYPRLEGQEE